MKLSPRPISPDDQIDQSRDMIGFNKWARSSRTISFIMLIFGWFTIPVEVLLRRDFGQRWFTVVNFYARLLLLLIFSLVQYFLHAIWDMMQDFFIGIAKAINPYYKEPEQTLADSVMNKSMRFFLYLYIVLGIYHLFKIWWRSRTHAALHSFDDGTSRLEPVAKHVIKPINKAIAPALALCMRLLPKQQRIVKTAPQLITDPRAFTNTVLEPLLLLILAIWLEGIARLWLFISAIALAIHAHWKETARLNKMLDFRDSIIEAKVMAELKEGVLQPNAQGRIMQQAAKELKDNPHVAPQINSQFTNLMSIIEEMNRDGSHLAV
jgi:hypothetical protein